MQATFLQIETGVLKVLIVSSFARFYSLVVQQDLLRGAQATARCVALLVRPLLELGLDAQAGAVKSILHTFIVLRTFDVPRVPDVEQSLGVRRLLTRVVVDQIVPVPVLLRLQWLVVRNVLFNHLVLTFYRLSFICCVHVDGIKHDKRLDLLIICVGVLLVFVFGIKFLVIVATLPILCYICCLN